VTPAQQAVALLRCTCSLTLLPNCPPPTTTTTIPHSYCNKKFLPSKLLVHLTHLPLTHTFNSQHTIIITTITTPQDSQL
jgi:hypothetical protein